MESFILLRHKRRPVLSFLHFHEDTGLETLVQMTLQDTSRGLEKLLEKYIFMFQDYKLFLPIF